MIKVKVIRNSDGKNVGEFEWSLNRTFKDVNTVFPFTRYSIEILSVTRP